MSQRNDWHDDDSFWLAMEPFMFTEQRWQGTPAEVDQLMALVPLEPGNRVCDVGCGPGRFSLELARRGFKVTGIDRTRPYLESGRTRATKEELAVDFFQADMRSFVRPDGFECVLSMFTSFGYFEDPADNRLVLENIFQSLSDDGVLVVEIMGKEVLARIFLERGWDQIGDVYLLQDRRVSKDWSWMENRWIIMDGASRFEFDVNHWIYSAVEIKQMLRDIGFARVQVFGNLQGEPYDQKAQRLVVVAYR